MVGKVADGGDATISVQSMCTTPTTDINATLQKFIGSQEVIPEALLPDGAMGSKSPGGTLGEVLELTHEGDDVAGR